MNSMLSLSARSMLIAAAFLGVASSASGQPNASAAKDSIVLFENDHIRFVEVMRRPGETLTLDAVPYTSIIAVDAPWPSMRERALDPTKESSGNRVGAPDEQPYPWCQVQTPSGPREITVTGNFPQHFYRVEYKRIDGPDLEANWKTWYPWALDPKPNVKSFGRVLQKGAPYSSTWPYSYVYRPENAAPANHYVRFEDEHVQLLEVVVRPGEEENVHGHPYRTVYADDGGFAPPGGAQDYVNLNPDAKIPFGKTGESPAGKWPVCKTSVPSGPHRIINTKGPLNHFYRVQFKRIDGDDIKTKWRDFYPQTPPQNKY